MSQLPRRLAPLAVLAAAVGLTGTGSAVAALTPVLVPVPLNALADTTIASTVAPNGDGRPMSLAMVPAGYKGKPLLGGDFLVGDVSNAAGVRGRGKSIVRISKGVTTGFSTAVAAPVGLTFNSSGTQVWVAGYGSTDNGSHGVVSVLKTQTTKTSVSGTAYTKGVIANSHGTWSLASNHSATSPMYFWTNVDGTLVRDSKIASPFATSTAAKNVHHTLATFAHAASRSLAAGTISAPQGMVWNPVTGTLFVASTALDQIVAVHAAGTATGTATLTQVAVGGAIHEPRAIALDRNTDDLLVVNGGDNNLVELTQTGTVVATRDLDPGQEAGAITGLVTAKGAGGQTNIYYLNGRTNTLHRLAPSASPVTLTGAPSATARYGQTVVISGNAPPGATVEVFFRRHGEYAYVQRRTLMASGTGAFSTSFAPNADYSYYAQVGSAKSAVLTELVAPSLPGPSDRRARRNSTIVLHGLAAPHTIVTLHFHKAGTPGGSFGLIRRVHSDSAGRWQKAVVVSVGYRVYASRGMLRPYSQQVRIVPG